MQNKAQRPVFLDLRKIRLPLVGYLSIFNRVTGVLMFLTAPLLIWLLGVSLEGAEGFARASAILDNLLVRLWLVVLFWSITHHMLSGIRFLLIDADVGVELEQANKSAVVVLAIGAAIAAITLIGVML